MNIFILDESNNTKSELKLIKPKTYNEFLNQIKLKCQIIPENYDIYFFDEKNTEIKINNEINYHKIKDILFIREINKNALEQSIFEINYNKLSESKQDILDEKYNCILCAIIIKNENPYLCYKCQKIFHEKCLKDWNNKCKAQNKKLLCPNCRNELPIENWHKKLEHEENRKEIANLMNIINELKSNKNINNIIDNKYEEYINKTLKIFNDILNKMKLLHSLLNLGNNIQLNNILINNQFNLDNFNNININTISKVINEEFDLFINQIRNKNIKVQNNLSNEIPLNIIEKEEININDKIEQLNIQNIHEVKKKEKFDVETLFKTLDGRIIFRNGILKGIVHKYYEINDVVSKIQDILAKGVKFNLVYKASELDDDALTFHQICDKLNMSLVLVETLNNTRFGGFTTQNWSGNNTKKYDNNAFVFNLENNTIFDVEKNQPAIGCYPMFGPVFFGCQIRIYDKFFTNGGTTCHAGLNYSTKIDYELNNGKKEFIVKDMEIYSIETVDV